MFPELTGADESRLTSLDERLDALRAVPGLEQRHDIVFKAVLGGPLTLAVGALGGGEHGAHTQRRRSRRDSFCQLYGPVELLPGPTTSCTKPIRSASASIEFIAGQQPAHRVAPPASRGSRVVAPPNG